MGYAVKSTGYFVLNPSREPSNIFCMMVSESKVKSSIKAVAIILTDLSERKK